MTTSASGHSNALLEVNTTSANTRKNLIMFAGRRLYKHYRSTKGVTLSKAEDLEHEIDKSLRDWPDITFL